MTTPTIQIPADLDQKIRSLEVKRKDVERYGSFRTKDLILQVYDAMAEVARTEVAYQTILDPPPGQGPRHPAR